MYATVKGRGFTVIELLIIVIIVAVLVSIVIPALFAAKQKAQQITLSHTASSSNQPPNSTYWQWTSFNTTYDSWISDTNY